MGRPKKTEGHTGVEDQQEEQKPTKEQAPRPFHKETPEVLSAFIGERVEDLPATIREACAACAPEDEIDKKMKFDPGSLTRTEKRALLLRKVMVVSIARDISRRFCRKESGARPEILDIANPFIENPSLETEQGVALALLGTDLVEVIRAKANKQQEDKGEPGSLVPQARHGSPAKQCEFYTLHSVGSAYPSRAAAYLYSVAMACARYFPRAQEPPRPSDYAHPLIVASINAANKRLE